MAAAGCCWLLLASCATLHARVALALTVIAALAALAAAALSALAAPAELAAAADLAALADLSVCVSVLCFLCAMVSWYTILLFYLHG